VKGNNYMSLDYDMNVAWPYRYVANFDILGMRYLLHNRKERALEMLFDFNDIKNLLGQMNLEIIETGEVIADQIARVSFSDTIVIFTKGNTIKDLWAMIVLGSQLFSKCLNRCIPLRGGIAYGEFFFDSYREIFCGLPLVEAHEIGEEAQWLGIVVTEEVAKNCAQNNISTGQQPGIVEWDVPLKHENSVRRYVINWPSVYRKNFTVTPPIYVEQFYRPFEEDFGKYSELPEVIKKKYVNTVDFINTRVES
jgi:hypothetical protein